MKTKNRFLHSILNHAITVDFVLQTDHDLTDLKWEGLSWSMVTSELLRIHACQGLVCEVLSGDDQVLYILHFSLMNHIDIIVYGGS